jgi:glyoxylase-like metal-dependent hydrolase (beta-lactamase superfamily II)
VIPLDNEGHAKDMVAVYVSGAGVIFITDVYSPNPAAKKGGPGAIALKRWIEKNKLTDVRIIAGGHGSSINYSAFTALSER